MSAHQLWASFGRHVNWVFTWVWVCVLVVFCNFVQFWTHQTTSISQWIHSKLQLIKLTEVNSLTIRTKLENCPSNSTDFEISPQIGLPSVFILKLQNKGLTVFCSSVPALELNYITNATVIEFRILIWKNFTTEELSVGAGSPEWPLNFNSHLKSTVYYLRLVIM